MRLRWWLLPLAFCLLLSGLPAARADSMSCPNKFPNFISDFCWSCMFPIRMFGSNITSFGNGEDFKTAADKKPFCICESALKLGAPLSFWEMSYIVDVHREPGCLPVLGGMKLNLPFAEKGLGIASDPLSPTPQKAYYNSTYYVSPLMYLLEVVVDDACSDRSSFDVGWSSEFDPTWNDDSMALIKMPISAAFSNIAAALAAPIDAASALVGFPRNDIFWQAGAWGPMYPLNGSVNTHRSSDTTARLIATRMLASAHGMKELAGLFSKGSGRSYACEDGELGCDDAVSKAAMCAASPSGMPPTLIMRKRQYKLQRIFPARDTKNALPIGRSTMLSERMVQTPLPGFADWGYAIFRKRDCCAGLVSP